MDGTKLTPQQRDQLVMLLSKHRDGLNRLKQRMIVVGLAHDRFSVLFCPGGRASDPIGHFRITQPATFPARRKTVAESAIATAAIDTRDAAIEPGIIRSRN